MEIEVEWQEIDYFRNHAHKNHFPLVQHTDPTGSEILLPKPGNKDEGYKLVPRLEEYLRFMMSVLAAFVNWAGVPNNLKFQTAVPFTSLNPNPPALQVRFVVDTYKPKP